MAKTKRPRPIKRRALITIDNRIADNVENGRLSPTIEAALIAYLRLDPVTFSPRFVPSLDHTPNRKHLNREENARFFEIYYQLIDQGYDATAASNEAFDQVHEERREKKDEELVPCSALEFYPQLAEAFTARWYKPNLTAFVNGALATSAVFHDKALAEDILTLRALAKVRDAERKEVANG